MWIQFKLNGTKYEICVESNQFIPIKFGINQDKDSKNFGNETSKELGYFSSMPNACKRCIREEIAMSDDVVSLQEFALRIDAINKELVSQLEAVDL